MNLDSLALVVPLDHAISKGQACAWEKHHGEKSLQGGPETRLQKSGLGETRRVTVSIYWGFSETQRRMPDFPSTKKRDSSRSSWIFWGRVTRGRWKT